MKPNRSHPTGRHMRGAAAPWVLGGFAAIALYFLLTEHRAHLLGALPFLLLAACPLLHMFHGHGDHGGHAGHAPDDAPAPAPAKDPPPASTGTPPAAHHHH